MPRLAGFKGGFEGGQLSDLMMAKTETEVYVRGAKEIKNGFVIQQGGVQNRPGSEFVHYPKYLDKKTILREFVFSQNQVYTLEFGHEYLRFFADEAPVVEAAKNITAITKANPAVVTIASHGYTNDQFVYIESVGGMTEVNDRWFRVKGVTANTFQLYTLAGAAVDSSAYTTYTSGGTAKRQLELYADPTYYWTETTVEGLRFVQSGDTIYYCHKDSAIQNGTILRLGHTSWSFNIWTGATAWTYSGGNYPSSVAIYEQRLLWGGFLDNPLEVIGSVAGNFNDYTLGTSATAAFKYVIGTGEQDKIAWMHADTYLLLGTEGGIFVMRGSGYDEAITPTNVQIKRQIGIKASDAQPQQVGDLTMFVQRLGKKMYALSLNNNTFKYGSQNVSIRADGILDAKVKSMAYQEEPNGILYALLEDGTIACCTLEQNEEVIAWSTLETDGFIESICSTPGANRDEIWMVVRRTIGGNVVRMIEVLKARDDSSKINGFFVDSGLVYSGAATTTLGNLQHLEGRTVKVLADGASHPDVVVTGGQVTLNRAVENAVVGLGYTFRLKTLPIPGQSANGTAEAKPKSIHTCTLRLYRTLGLQAGLVDGTLRPVIFRLGSDPMDASPPLFTGDKVIELDNDWNEKADFVIQQDQPFPVTILGYAIEYNVNDG